MRKLPNITDLEKCPFCEAEEYIIYSKPIGKISEYEDYAYEQYKDDKLMEVLNV